MSKILIIPDVHGRTFWKDAVEKHKDEVDKIVFLGDMVDPYPWEGITRKESITNLQEIIDFKRENKNKVILLLGNHDFPYLDNRNFYTRSRYDSSNARHIEEMFRSHRSLFQLAYEHTMGDKKYLFTHAGLIYEWYLRHKDLIGELTVNNLNSLQNTPNGIKALCEISRIRGGWDKYGSIVWADIDELRPEGMNENLPWDYQIVGHSQQKEHPVITKEWACLDCRRAFILTEDGGFQEV